MTGRINGSDLGGPLQEHADHHRAVHRGGGVHLRVPLFSGFVSKSMVMSAALSEGYHGVWLALLFASAGVFHHAGSRSPSSRSSRTIRGFGPPSRPRTCWSRWESPRSCACSSAPTRACSRPAAVRHRLHGVRHHPRAGADPILFFSGARVRVAEALRALPAGAAVGEHRLRVDLPAGRMAGRAGRAFLRRGHLRRARQRGGPDRAGRREWARRSFGPEGKLAEAWDTSRMAIRDDRRALRIPDVFEHGIPLTLTACRSRRNPMDSRLRGNDRKGAGD